MQPFLCNPACQEYKSAASFILNKSSSRAEREALTSTLRSLSGQVVAGIAASRRLTETQVRKASGGSGCRLCC
jgi:hypothetical protein